MKPEQELSLSIYEGQNWQPRVNHKTFVRARIGDKVAETDKEDLTDSPHFNTILTWQIMPDVLRRYKTEKVPIKVECISISPDGQQEELGYIILPLNTAVVGIPVQSHWHKLLGGPMKKYKFAPELHMNLELKDPEEENKVEKGGTAKTKVQGRRRGGRSLGSNTIQDLPKQPPRRASFHEIKEEPDYSDDDYNYKENGSEVLPNGRRFKSRTSSSESLGPNRSSFQSPEDLARDVARQQSNITSYDLEDEGTSGLLIKTENGIEDEYDFSGFMNGQMSGHNISEGNMSGRISRGLPGGSGLSGYHSFSEGNISARAKRGLPGGSGFQSQRPPKVQAYYNDTMSFFQIGTSNDPDEQSYIMSVIIVYAKNIDQLFPTGLLDSQDPVYFQYSLLGCAIKTDTIDDIFNPSFGAQRSDVNIRSTPSNLSVYFSEQHQLLIHLLLGDLCLASTSVSLSSFCNLEESSGKPSCQQGQYTLVPIIVDDINQGRIPILGVMVQLNRVSLLKSPGNPRERMVIKEEVISSSSSCDADESDEVRSPLVVRAKRNMSVYKHHKNQKLLAGEINKQRAQLLCAAACEVETWKDNLQDVFWKQWTARENELQNHLAAEWRIRLNSIEGHLDTKLQKCDALQSRLASALNKVSAREVGLRKREIKLEQLESELQEQHRMLKERDKNPTAQHADNDDVWAELMAEKHNRRRLEKKVAELQGKLVLGETKIKEQEGPLEEAQQICKKQEVMNEKLKSVELKKQYYKLQWVRAVSQLHQMYVAQAQDTLTIRSEVENRSPEPFASTSMINTAEDPDNESLLFLESQGDAGGSKPLRRGKSNSQLSVNQDRMKKRNLSEMDSSESSESEPRRHTYSSKNKTPVKKERRREQDFSMNEVKWLEKKGKSSRRINDNSDLMEELERFRNGREELLRSTNVDQYEAKLKSMNRDIIELMGT